MGKRKKPIDQNSKKLYYTIKEVAEHFAINESRLRFWEKEFEDINPKKTESGIRQYTKKDIAIIEIIYNLVEEKGLTLDGVKHRLKTKKDEDIKKMETIENLKLIKKELKDLELQFDELHNIQKYTNPDIKE